MQAGADYVGLKAANGESARDMAKASGDMPMLALFPPEQTFAAADGAGADPRSKDGARPANVGSVDTGFPGEGGNGAWAARSGRSRRSGAALKQGARGTEAAEAAVA